MDIIILRFQPLNFKGVHPLKINIETQNDAMFEAGDTFSKLYDFGIYVLDFGDVHPLRWKWMSRRNTCCKWWTLTGHWTLALMSVLWNILSPGREKPVPTQEDTG